MSDDPHIDGTDPSDDTTLTVVLEGYRADGFVGDFFAEEGGRVRCGGCATVLDAGRLDMVSLRRLEGASDPADNLAVIATFCRSCGMKGTLVLGYGPMASQADSDVMLALNDRRSEAGEPPASSTAELPDDDPQRNDEQGAG